jgi:hypothetical protein
MARSIAVVVTDDLDGSPGAETVAFSLDGVSYEIDLGQPNRARLAGALAPFIAAGRRVRRGGRRRAAGREVPISAGSPIRRRSAGKLHTPVGALDRPSSAVSTAERRPRRAASGRLRDAR